MARAASARVCSRFRLWIQVKYSNLRPLHLFYSMMKLLRGIEPHFHPRTESSGVVWGRPSPPALDSCRWVRLRVARRSRLPGWAMCRSLRGACRTRGRRSPPALRGPPVDRAHRSNVPAPAGCYGWHIHECRSGEVCTRRVGPGGVGTAGSSAPWRGAVWSGGTGPAALGPSESGTGARGPPDRGRDRGVRTIRVRARARGPA